MNYYYYFFNQLKMDLKASIFSLQVTTLYVCLVVLSQSSSLAKYEGDFKCHNLPKTGPCLSSCFICYVLLGNLSHTHGFNHHLKCLPINLVSLRTPNILIRLSTQCVYLNASKAARGGCIHLEL